MRIRAWACGGVWMTTLMGALLAGCGGEPSVDGEYLEPAEPESASEQTSEQPTHSAFATCPTKLVTWSKPYTTFWHGNTATKGTYYCSATLSPTAGGSYLKVSANSPTRKGEAQYQCLTTGVWAATPTAGFSCDGAIVETKAVSGHETTCASYTDPVRQKWISWFLIDLRRCPDVVGLDWWVNAYKNNTSCSQYTELTAKDACWRANFQDGANRNGNSYNEVLSTGHISSFDEGYLCTNSSTGEQLAYPWTVNEGNTLNGTKCKYRP